jgi:hypothetical protein
MLFSSLYTAPSSTTTPSSKAASRSIPPCPYGRQCQDRNRLHRTSFSHPTYQSPLVATSLVTPARLRNTDQEASEGESADDDDVTMPWQSSKRLPQPTRQPQPKLSAWRRLSEQRQRQQEAEAFVTTATQRSPQRRRRKDKLDTAPKYVGCLQCLSLRIVCQTLI